MEHVLFVHGIISFFVILSPIFIIKQIKKINYVSKKKNARYVINNITGEKVLISDGVTKKASYVLLGIVSSLLSVCFFVVVVPFMFDCGYILMNGIPRMSGYIVEDISYSNKESVREKLMIEDSVGNRKELNVEATGYKKGDYVVVDYLPNLEIGVIVK